MTGNDSWVTPEPATIRSARSKIINGLPAEGLGEATVRQHLQNDIVPGLNGSSTTSRYYGFVTGGVTPAAALADNLVTAWDQNVAVHLPEDTVSTTVEDRALQMVAELTDASHIGARVTTWTHRTFTTGATAANVVGLALGREYVVREAGRRRGQNTSVAQAGLFKAMQQAGLEEIQIIGTAAHSSLSKAASIVGLGRDSIKDISTRPGILAMDLGVLESYLQRQNTASIIAISCAEINTGFYATDEVSMGAIAELAAKYGAWVHVDAAFGLTAAILPDTTEFRTIKQGTAGLHLANSITADGHKMLNVPYDCGIFFSRHLALATEVFQNPNAAYLDSPAAKNGDASPSAPSHHIPSPLNIGIENSRRFRALPVYASLIAYGRNGYTDMITRQVRLARKVAEYIARSSAFALLPLPTNGETLTQRLDSIYMITLFRAHDEKLNAVLTRKLNSTRRLYVSGTKWDGQPATRFAFANWQVNVHEDFELIKQVLDSVSADDGVISA